MPPLYGVDLSTWHLLLQFGATHNIFLALSAVNYILFAVGLVSLGFRHHHAVLTKSGTVTQFPEGYFTMLAVQLVPLTITGFVIADPYIISTRLVTLFSVIVVYALTTTQSGSFNTFRFRAWMFFWFSVLVFSPFLWMTWPPLKPFVIAHEKWIAWLSIVVMILFVVKGQFVVAKALFRHYVAGNYTNKRYSMQWVRFFGYLFQTLHYWVQPSDATAFWGIDPIFLQGAIGAMGVAYVLIRSTIGWVIGTALRRTKRAQDLMLIQTAA